MNYKVHQRTQIAPGKWECSFEYWQGCYCERKEGSVIVESVRIPRLSQIKDVHLTPLHISPPKQ